jgi:hypothetical protein
LAVGIDLPRLYLDPDPILTKSKEKKHPYFTNNQDPQLNKDAIVRYSTASEPIHKQGTGTGTGPMARKKTLKRKRRYPYGNQIWKERDNKIKISFRN